MSTYVYGTLIGTYEVLTPQKINCFLYYSKLNINHNIYIDINTRAHKVVHPISKVLQWLA